MQLSRFLLNFSLQNCFTSDNEDPSQSTVLEHHSPTLLAEVAGHRCQQRTQPEYRQLSKSIQTRLPEDTGILPSNSNPSSLPRQSALEIPYPDQHHPVPPSDLHQMTANALATQCSVTPSHYIGAHSVRRSDPPVNQPSQRRSSNTPQTKHLRYA